MSSRAAPITPIDLRQVLADLAAREEDPPGLYRIDDPRAPDPVIPCWIFRTDTGRGWEWDGATSVKRQRRFRPDGSFDPAWTLASHWSTNPEDQQPPPPPSP